MRIVTCVNCHGSGYVYRIGADGMKRPITCRGCNGSGSQQVAS